MGRNNPKKRFPRSSIKLSKSNVTDTSEDSPKSGNSDNNDNTITTSTTIDGGDSDSDPFLSSHSLNYVDPLIGMSWATTFSSPIWFILTLICCTVAIYCFPLKFGFSRAASSNAAIFLPAQHHFSKHDHEASLIALSSLKAGEDERRTYYIYRAQVLLALDKPEEAMASYEAALEAAGNQRLATALKLKLANLYLINYYYENASIHYNQILNSIDATTIVEKSQAAFGLGRVYQAQSDFENAVLLFEKALELDPKKTTTTMELATSWMELGQFENAIEELYRHQHSQNLLFSEKAYLMLEYATLALGQYEKFPLNMTSDFRKQCWSGRDTLPFSHHPPSFISSLFNTLVAPPVRQMPHFVQSYYGLLFDNAASELLSLVTTEFGISPGDHWLDIIDIGCGTGIAGREFYSISNTITGIDIANEALECLNNNVTVRDDDDEMIISLYDTVLQDDAVSALEKLPAQSADAVIAADSIPYFSDIEFLFSLVNKVLRADGIFAFTIETKHNLQTNALMSYNGRITHLPSYIAKIATEFNLTVVATKDFVGSSKRHYSVTKDKHLRYNKEGEEATAKAYVLSK